VRSALLRVPAPAATAVVVAALAASHLAAHLLSAPRWLGPVEAGALLAFARLTGSTWAQLGLSRLSAPSGCRWGLAAVGVVTVVYGAGVLLPATRRAFLDSRNDVPVDVALTDALVTIPFGTVLLEEVAFRSVLWAVLARHLTTAQVLGTTSALFGIWHVLPALRLASAHSAVTGVDDALVIAATMLFTALGGLVFGELRRRSDSVLASALAHHATNALGVLFGVLAWHLAR
jgi:membrane protease YdiL (CAAX protease family)